MQTATGAPGPSGLGAPGAGRPPHPDAAAACDRGVAAAQAGDVAAAVAAFRQALAIDPLCWSAEANLGLALIDFGLIEEAVDVLAAALLFAPREPHLLSARGDALFRLGRWAEAEQELRKAVAADPNAAAPLIRLGAALDALDRPEEAASAYAEATLRDPDAAAAWCNLGGALTRLRKPRPAERAFAQAVRCDPSLVEAHLNLGLLLAERDDLIDAARHFDSALAQDPAAVEARWARCFALLPRAPDTVAEEDAALLAYDAALDDLERRALDPALDPDRAAGLLALGQPFFLAYHGADATDRQRRFGRLAAGIMARARPQWAQTPPRPPLETDGRLRIGVASPHFRRHSVWRAITAGWLEGLDRSRFKLFGYHLGPDADDAADHAAARFDVYARGPRPADAWAETIRADRLHGLIHPDVGMDGLALRLAASRLAPVQMIAWGHPLTSGLPTLDYYLSADLLEPPDGDAHYSERLVRLPGVGCRPLDDETAAAALGRAALGLPDDAPIAACVQTPYKMRPADDAVLIAVAQRLPELHFLFFEDPTHPRLAEKLIDRLRRACVAAKLAPERIHLSPRLTPSAFLACLDLCDIYLDSLGFSGFNTAMLACGRGLPVVTLDGPFMRGRLAAAVLRRLDAEGLIAQDRNAYVAIIVDLIRDPERRRAVSDHLRRASATGWKDDAPIRALERFLEEACAP